MNSEERLKSCIGRFIVIKPELYWYSQKESWRLDNEPCMLISADKYLENSIYNINAISDLAYSTLTSEDDSINSETECNVFVCKIFYNEKFIEVMITPKEIEPT